MNSGGGSGVGVVVVVVVGGVVVGGGGGAGGDWAADGVASTAARKPANTSSRQANARAPILSLMTRV
jgi:hypothetical protein